MKINVTQEDIDNATRNGASTCPIARAVKRITGHPYDVTVSPVAICLHTEDGSNSVKWFKPSKNAVAFMGRFDDSLRVKPAAFICPELP